jgi:hypothetical protein
MPNSKNDLETDEPFEEQDHDGNLGDDAGVF